MAAALRVIVKDPAPATTFFIVAVASFVRMTGKTREAVETRLFVTVRVVAPAAKFTVPALLFIVCAPVVAVAVFVASIPNDPEFPIVRLFVGDAVPMPTLPVLVIRSLSMLLDTDGCVKNTISPA